MGELVEVLTDSGGPNLAQDENLLFRQLVEGDSLPLWRWQGATKDVLRGELEVGRLHERMILGTKGWGAGAPNCPVGLVTWHFEEFPDNLPVITRPRALMTEGGSATPLRYRESSAMVALKSHPMLQNAEPEAVCCQNGRGN